DFSMFEKVGNAHAINPSYELIERLYNNKKLREKTKIHVERKDVNYTFLLSDLNVDFHQF
ncbi:MAG: HAD-IB family hydrolase, partial [Anaerococcus vaginalis]|nr:HAD-IB family hydrolase [Anaerococcus vaginalis]